MTNIDTTILKLQKERLWRPEAVAVIYRIAESPHYVAESRAEFLVVQSSAALRKDPIYPIQWSPVQGGVEDNEPYMTAFFREIVEESGIPKKELDIQAINFFNGKLSHLPGRSDRNYQDGKVYFTTLAEHKGESPIICGKGVHAYQWATINQAINLFELGEPIKGNFMKQMLQISYAYISDRHGL